MKTTISVVFWDNINACFSTRKKSGYEGRIYGDILIKYNSIIGNIHDNPELLETPNA